MSRESMAERRYARLLRRYEDIAGKYRDLKAEMDAAKAEKEYRPMEIRGPAPLSPMELPEDDPRRPRAP